MTAEVDIITKRKLGARTYDLSDQTAFARFSGDWNPMHVDPVAARRTQAGAPAVHGIHNFLWAMEQVAKEGVDLTRYGAYKVQFHKFVLVGTTVTVAYEEGEKLRVDLWANGASVLGVSAKPGETQMRMDDEFASFPIYDRTTTPLELDLSDMETQRGWLASPEPEGAPALFPHLSSAWGAEKVAAIALLSTVVGMYCPGLHSIFAGFTLKIGELDAGRPGLGFRCTRADERFRAVSIHCVASGLTADLSTFARIPPVAAPTIRDLRGKLDLDLTGRLALIVGGSRGLGAATAKLFAAAGGRVLITYAVGKDDAQAIVDEIRDEFGPGAAAMLHYDARGDSRAQLQSVTDQPTDVFYFATGRIGSLGGTVFDRGLFDAHADIYLSGFADLCSVVAERWNGDPIEIVYPSTIAIDERPSEMIEYAMVKAAGEILCQELAKAHPALRIRWPRIPRVLTDQTATVVHVKSADAVDVMLQILRGEHSCA